MLNIINLMFRCTFSAKIQRVISYCAPLTRPGYYDVTPHKMILFLSEKTLFFALKRMKNFMVKRIGPYELLFMAIINVAKRTLNAGSMQQLKLQVVNLCGHFLDTEIKKPAAWLQ